MRDRYPRLLGTLLLSLLLLSGSVFAQNKGSISGRVIDENGEPLPGTTVLLENVKKGQQTASNGSFTFAALDAGEYTVVFTFIGYETVRYTISLAEGESKTVNANMREEAKELDEVVIVGYGTQRKRDLTGSISKIQARNLNDVIGSSFENTLQGKAAGVQVIQSSGIAGAGAIVRVRGIGSLSAGGDPLYVVDGIPITQDPFLNGDRGGQNNNPLASINPADIESIEILKDAAAAGIYGSRGANGVVLITTKRGKAGKPRVNFSSRIGFSEPANRIDFLNADEWLQLRQEAFENDGGVGRAPLPAGLSYDSIAGVNTDWYDHVLRTGFKHEYNLGFSQGTKKIKTYVGLSYTNTQSYLIGNSYERMTARANIDWNILDNLRLSLSSSGARGVNNRISQAWAGGLGTAQSNALPIYDTDQIDGFNNPIRQRDLVDWRTVELRSINNLTLEFKPIDGLTINATGNLDFMDMGDNIYEDSLWDNANNIARAKEWAIDVFNYNANAYATYDFKLPENHNLSLMAGSEVQRSNTESSYLEITNVDKHIYLDPEPQADTDTIETEDPTQAWSFASFFARANYKLMNKFIFQGSARVDGSSRFGANNRYGFFPTAAFAYIISEESFLQNVDWINFLKLKTSYGVTGSSDIPNYERFGTFSPRDNNVNYNGQGTIFPVRLANPDLAWETATTIDAGFEIGFLQDRITAEFSVYNRLSKDVLVNTATQASTGFERFFQNVGEVRNRGVEFSITSRNLVGAFRWTTNLNMAHNNNKVISIGITTPDAIAGSGDTRVIPGYPVGVNFLVRMDHVDPETGLPVFLDPDGNETFTWSESNRVIVGNVIPKLVGGITNTFNYAGFDLEILVTYAIGGNIYDDAAKRQLGVFTDWNMRRDIINRWTTPGQVGAEYPRLTLDPTTYGGMGSEWFYNTDQWLYNASFARLKKITFGYNFDFTNAKFLRSLRVYYTGTNLLTWTAFPGSDPEIVRDHNGPQGRNISPNVTYLTPPQERTYALGLNLEF